MVSRLLNLLMALMFSFLANCISSVHQERAFFTSCFRDGLGGGLLNSGYDVIIIFIDIR